MSARRLLVLLAGVLTVGCGRTAIRSAPPPVRAAVYSPTERLRVMLPVGDEAAGRIVSVRVVGVLRQTHGDVTLVPTSDGAAALAAARATRAAYLVAPVIVEWTDGDAPPLGRDRVAVRLELREVAAGETVSAVTFENASPALAVSDTDPEALLDGGFDRAVTLLIATGTAPESEPVRVRRPRSPDPESMDARQFPRQ